MPVHAESIRRRSHFGHRLTKAVWTLAVPAALSAGLVLVLSVWGLLERADGRLYDLALRLLAPPPASGASAAGPVAVVVIDDATLRRYGQWPLPRRCYAALLDLLRTAGARAVGFDLILAEPDRHGPASDAAFARAIREGPPVVLGLAGAAKVRRPDRGGGLVLLPPYSQPLAAFRAAGAGLGHLLALPDSDGVVRQVPLEVVVGESAVPAFCLALVRASSAGPANYGWQSADPNLRLDYRLGAVEQHPLVDVLEGRVRREVFRNKVVIVGASASGLPDRYHTPLTVAGDQVPGVQLQALAVASLFSGGIRRVPDLGTAGLATLSSLAGAAAATAGPWAVLLGLVGGLSVFGLSLLFLTAGWWLPAAQPIAALAAGVVLGLVSAVVIAYRERLHLASLLGRYLSPQVFAELLRQSPKPLLTGEKVDLTVLFADLRGFTDFTAGRSPEEAVEILNRYLDAMVEAVHRAGGTVDKFLGDGVMAFFGAPLPEAGHCRAAVAAALDVVWRTSALGRQLAAEGRPELHVGVGLASGEALVGSIGAENRMDYTAIGPPVNLASRLEALAGADEVLMDARTWRESGMTFGVPHHEEEVEVKGWPHPVTVVRLSVTRVTALLESEE